MANREERRQRITDALAVQFERTGSSIGVALCATTVDVLHVSGAAITLQAPGADAVSYASSGPDMARLEELEQTLGEGPCIDAFRLGESITEPDLTTGTRWPAYTAGALQVHARAAFGYPLSLDGALFGALNLYNDRRGSLSDDQHQDAIVMAEVMATSLLRSVSDEDAATFAPDSEDLAVHQATGMIAVQLAVPIEEARLRLRAHAFAQERPLSEVARDVVARRLRLER